MGVSHEGKFFMCIPIFSVHIHIMETLNKKE